MDRMLAGGAAPFTTVAIGDPAEFELSVQREIADRLRERGDNLTDDQIADLAVHAVNDPAAVPHAIDRFDVATVEAIPVFAADDVARYCYGLPDGTTIEDVVSSLAPPFDRFWVEFQRSPVHNFEDIHGWGVLVESQQEPMSSRDSDGTPRWTLRLSVFLELRKGTVMGPVFIFLAGLSEDGTFLRHADGDIWWAGTVPEMTARMPEDALQEYAAQVVHLVVPALLTISLMHCTNVETETIEPPPKLSRKHEKRHGRPLVRYQVLDVEPMRRILDEHGATDTGLRHALHISRGHFKVFTEDAPLFGKHAGTYWWSPHIRGDAAEGVNVNDYRIHAPGDIGRTYIEADEDINPRLSVGKPGDNPDATRRGTAAHAKTQNLIAEAVREGGFDPRSPKAGEPEFDLAWTIDDITFVCEVKSITDSNEEIQMRLALAQVLRYCQRLNATGLITQAVIAVERELSDDTWSELLVHEHIILVWPAVAAERIAAASEEPSSGSPR
jgi:hypothetical protein